MLDRNIFSKNLSIPTSPTLGSITSPNSTPTSPQISFGFLDCVLDWLLFFSGCCKRSKTLSVEKTQTTIISLSTDLCDVASINNISDHVKIKKNKDFHNKIIKNSTDSFSQTSSDECNVSNENFSDHDPASKDLRKSNNCKVTQTYVDSRTKKVATTSVGINIPDRLEEDTMESFASFVNFELPVSPCVNKKSRKAQQTNHKILSISKSKDNMPADIVKSKYIELKEQFQFIGQEPLQNFLKEHQDNKSLIEDIHKMLFTDHSLNGVVKEKMRKEIEFVLKSINRTERQMQIQHTFETHPGLVQPDRDLVSMLQKFLKFKENLAKQVPSIILNKQEEIQCLTMTAISLEQLRQLKLNPSPFIRATVLDHAIVEKILLDIQDSREKFNIANILEYMLNRVTAKGFDDELKIFIKHLASHKQINVSEEEWILSFENFYKLQMGIALPAMFYKAIAWLHQINQTSSKTHIEEWMYELVDSSHNIENCIFKEFELFCENNSIHTKYLMLVIDFIRYQLNDRKILLKINNMRDSIVTKLNDDYQDPEENSMLLFSQPKAEDPFVKNELLRDTSLHNQFDCYEYKI